MEANESPCGRPAKENEIPIQEILSKIAESIRKKNQRRYKALRSVLAARMKEIMSPRGDPAEADYIVHLIEKHGLDAVSF